MLCIELGMPSILLWSIWIWDFNFCVKATFSLLQILFEEDQDLGTLVPDSSKNPELDNVILIFPRNYRHIRGVGTISFCAFYNNKN